MTATHASGLPWVEDGLLVSTNPATGAEVARVPEIADLLGRECGKPVVDGVTETAAFLPHIAWAAGNARRVLGLRRVRGSRLVLELSARLEYQPLGVVGAIGPWNYPAGAIWVLAAYALAPGNAMVYQPSQHTPGVSQRLAVRFAEVVTSSRCCRSCTGWAPQGPRCAARR